MSLPHGGDEEFGASQKGPFSKEEVGPQQKPTPARFAKPPANSFHASELSASGGWMDRVRRAQEGVSDTCCSWVDDLPTPVFLALAAILLILLVLFIAAIVTYAMAKTGNAAELSSEAQSKPNEQRTLEVGPDSENRSRRLSGFGISFDGIFSAERPMSSNLELCTNHGFICLSDPSIVISTLQRCDGFGDCPDGSDEKSCQECNTAFKCPITLKGKTTGFLCLRNNSLCDGKKDCDDGSDELLCRKTCGRGEYKCYTTNKCIPNSFKCDGEVHCFHKDDEQKCDGKCNGGAVWCQNSNMCIPKWKLCDGIWDCIYGEDEKNCTCRECCGTNKALCKGTNICITRNQVCDGNHDCPDGSDEENCPGICDREVLKRVETVLCSDGHRYSKSIACAGLLTACDGKCDKCDSVHAFACADGKRCVSKLEVCDGKPNCADGSDEANCEKGRKYRCVRSVFGKHVKWLTEAQFCDGVRDCLDDDDERNCNYCQNGAILCYPTRTCLSSFQRCDGVLDCPDGSDEQGCTCEDCSYRYPPLYKCANSDRCVRFEEACFTEGCTNQTINEKHFCARREFFPRVL